MDIGIYKIDDLKGRDPEDLYNLSNIFAGRVQDKCLLYVFRCAIYFTENKIHDPKKLKWWYWKDAR